MLNVTPLFDRMRLSTTSPAMATTDIANLVRESPVPMDTARKFVHDLLSIDVTFAEPIYAGVVCKKLVVECIKLQCQIEDEQAVLDMAFEYASNYCADPNNSFLWAQPDEDGKTSAITTQSQVSDKVETKVAVNNATGKIAKGGKNLLATELFDKFVVNAEKPMTNKEFIQLLVVELGMTPMGASTYSYNRRKAAGMVTSKTK